MTREQAAAILLEREGFELAENPHISTDALVRAARARAGQPCSDCEQLVVYRDDDWHHVETPTTCFLARRDEHPPFDELVARYPETTAQLRASGMPERRIALALARKRERDERITRDELDALNMGERVRRVRGHGINE